jgi:RNA polymerase sigma-70 factor (ECF subfamily)
MSFVGASDRLNTLMLAPASVADERDLLERAVALDAAAIGSIYDLHHEALCSFAHRLLGDTQAAEDLVHDVFVHLPRLLGRFEPGRSLRSFLMSIAANHARHHLRSASRRRQTAARFALEPEASTSTPEQEVERRLIAAALRRALDGLPFDQRVAFVLCEVEGHHYREAAEILGVPEGTVRRRLFDARQKLHARLAKEGVL